MKKEYPKSVVAIKENGIYFPAKLKKGVPYVPKWQDELAFKIAEDLGKPIKEMGGNFEYSWYLF